MPTHALPKDSRNVAVNMLNAEWRLIDRLAFDAGLPTGEFIRKKLRLGIAQTKPQAAKLLIQIRRSRPTNRAIGSAVQLAIFFFWMATGGEQALRSGRSVRPVRSTFSRRIELA